MSHSASGDFSGDFPQLPNDSLSDINKMLKKIPQNGSSHLFWQAGQHCHLCSAGPEGRCGFHGKLRLRAGVGGDGAFSDSCIILVFFSPNLRMFWGALRSLHLTSRILTPSSQVLSSHHSTSPLGPEAVSGGH